MKPTLLLAAAALAATLGLVSCSTGGRSPSGFLGNYAQLNSGYGTEDAVSAFVNPEANFRKYDSVMFEPVTTVVASPAATPAVTDQLAAYLSEALRKELGARMAVVGTPGPSTMRVRVALTDVIEDQTRAALDGVVAEHVINWVWMPPWGLDKITDDGREMLRALGFNV